MDIVLCSNPLCIARPSVYPHFRDNPFYPLNYATSLSRWGSISITMLLANVRSRMIPAMGRDRTQPATPDLFSTARVKETTSPTTEQVSPAQAQRHVLPKDLPNAVKHLTDRELDLLITASVEEARRRGRVPPSVDSETLVIEGQAAS
jgi:hypothetical protein